MNKPMLVEDLAIESLVKGSSYYICQEILIIFTSIMNFSKQVQICLCKMAQNMLMIAYHISFLF